MLTVNGTAFWIADERGDATDGLFIDDIRHLHRWRLLLDGAQPALLTPGVLAPRTGRGRPAPYTVFRTQAVDPQGLTERLRIVNHGAQPRTVEVEYAFGADFADQFELRTDRTYDKPGAELTVDGATVRYRRGDYLRQTTVTASVPPAVGEGRLTWHLSVPGHGETVLDLSAGPGGAAPRDATVLRERSAADVAAFIAAAAAPASGRPDLDLCVRQGLRDLASMRVQLPMLPGLRIPGAGVPWFLTLFGRDSALSALFALPYLPDLARDVLRALAATQGSRIDPAHLEEPGKIIHEVRSGELAVFDQIPYGRYYGSVDSTPLFLMLLAAHGELAGELEAPARAAVDWMLRRGGLDEHGYLVYRTDGPGLVHQCWKDSPDSICFRDGTPATGPIAAAEVQGYAYAALRGIAGLARDVWADPHYADVLDARADKLQADFAADFWLADTGFVALALDGQRRQVDALASNAGHVLWTGILDQQRGRSVADKLGQDDFFSGWGIRTLAAGQECHHPMSYHNGSVWPHDTAIAVAGMRRYGAHAAADRVADGLLAAGAAAGGRLPEVMSGLTRQAGQGPIPYPHSCSPQAWAAAAPLLLLDTGQGRPRLP